MNTAEKPTAQFVAKQNAEAIARLLSRQADEKLAQQWLTSMNRQVNQATEAYYNMKASFPEANIKVSAEVFAPLQALQMAAEMLATRLEQPDSIFPYYRFHERIGDMIITFRTTNYAITTEYKPI